jgi:isocitrate/isopropylmalate dehydrogenase
MKSFNIAVIAGDSIGKEVVPEGIPGMPPANAWDSDAKQPLRSRK